MTLREIPKRPTLKDVARLAGVDASLVSRVVSNDPGLSIPDSTRSRVLSAVATVGYRPSAAARSLRTQRLSTLGLIVPDLTNPVYAPIVAGAQVAAGTAGIALLLASDTEGASPEGAEALVRMLAEDRVDGILLASGSRSDVLIRIVAATGKPTVLVNRAAEGIPSVTVDDQAGARIATAHLVEKGHERIMHLAGPAGVDTTRRRLAGYLDVVDSTLMADSASVTNAKGWSARHGYEAGHALLDRADGASAVFIANVTMAVGFYRAAHERGIRIPDDLSVVALHDYDLAAMIVPSLTTVSMPLRELGASAVNQLLGIVDGAMPHNLMISRRPVLVERESVRDLAERSRARS